MRKSIAAGEGLGSVPAMALHDGGQDPPNASAGGTPYPPLGLRGQNATDEIGWGPSGAEGGGGVAGLGGSGLDGSPEGLELGSRSSWGAQTRSMSAGEAEVGGGV